jgi:hypothetical protein
MARKKQTTDVNAAQALFIKAQAYGLILEKFFPYFKIILGGYLSSYIPSWIIHFLRLFGWL